jgi:hypothetical protein
MPRPQPQPAIRKAPTRPHPVAPVDIPAADEPARQSVEEPMALFSTRLPRSTQRRLKVYAASTGNPIQAIVEAAITAHLDQAATKSAS